MNSNTQFFNDSGSIGPESNCYLPSSPSPMEDDEHLTSQTPAPYITRRLRTVSTDLSMDEFAAPQKRNQWVFDKSNHYDEYDEINNDDCPSAVVPSTPPPRSLLSLTANVAGRGLSICMKPFHAGISHFDEETTYDSAYDFEDDDELEDMLFSAPCHRRHEVFAEDSMGYGVVVSSSSLSFDEEEDYDDDDMPSFNMNGISTPPLTPKNQKSFSCDAPPRIKNAPSFRSTMDFLSETSSQCKLPHLRDF
jgi:hypothetical protein